MVCVFLFYLFPFLTFVLFFYLLASIFESNIGNYSADVTQHNLLDIWTMNGVELFDN